MKQQNANPNPPLKDIDIQTQKGLDLLKLKAKHYGHYAEQLKVLELIQEIETLRTHLQDELHEFFKDHGF